MNLQNLCASLIFIAILFLSSNSMAETVIEAKKEFSAKSEEVVLLKAQLKSIEGHQSQLISIIQWSLSSIIAMALGLAAFNWYTSKVSYQREIQAIIQESNAKFNELNSQLIGSFDDHSKKLLAGLESKKDDIKNLVIKELQKKFDKQTAILNGYKSRILSLEYATTERLAEEAMSKGRLDWGIHNYCELLGISVKQGSDFYQAGEILDEISKALDNPKISMSSDTISKTIATLQKLPERHSAVAEILIKKINNGHAKIA